MTISIAFVVNLLVALLLVWLLWFVIKQFPFPEPFPRIVDIVFVAIAVLVLISALTGRVPLRLMS